MGAELPHGPRGRLLATYRIMSDPLHWTLRWTEQYGQTFTIRAMNGDVVVFTQAEAIKEIFSAPPDVYAVFAAETFRPLVGSGSILLSTGQRHRRDRKLLTPPFHGERMRAYAETMVRIAHHHFDKAVKNGATTMQTLASDITLDVIIENVFGVVDEGKIDEFRRVVSDYSEAFKPFLAFTRSLHKPWFGPWRRFSASFDRFDRLLQQQIEASRNRENGEDILSLMLQSRYDDGEPMEDAVIRDQLRTLLLAGHVTTATNLAWTTDFLWRSAEVVDRARTEVEAFPDELAQATAGTHLPYVDACWKEALRICPPTTEIVRLLAKDWTFHGVEVPAGKSVAASTVTVHHDPEIYPEPKSFKPERFIERRFAPHEYLPFGGGSRRCIGAAFSGLESKLVLATLLRDYEVKLTTEPAQMKRVGALLGPDTGTPIELRRR